MSTPTVARPRPQPTRRRPRPNAPVARLDSLNTPPRFVSTSPAPQGPRNVCPYPDCGSTSLQEENGSLYCTNCARIISEANPYVSDPQFTETSSGAPQLQGQYIAADQSHARISGAGYGTRGGRGGSQLQGRVRGEGMDSGKKTRDAARRVIMDLITRRGLPHNLADMAVNFFSIAQRGSNSAVVPLSQARNAPSPASFLAGRTLESVAACCLYIACRKRDPPRDAANVDSAAQVMLIDFAEIIEMNVFLLGKTFTRLIKHIWGTTNPDSGRKGGQIDEKHSMQLLASPPESLVERFVGELEFDRRDQPKIKMDAVNIVRRMKRDWLHYGRRPAGICGAAVILAARMNNYRRTVREVVLIAKVTEITINKRLEEFKFTESSNLTVDGFRNERIRNALNETDPPAFYTAKGIGPFTAEATSKRKRGRPKKISAPAPETAAEIEGEAADTDGNPPVTKRVRFDRDGFRIPDIPIRKSTASQHPVIDPQLLGNATAIGVIAAETSQSAVLSMQESVDGGITGPATRTRSRGRPLGTKNKPPRPPTSSELQLEQELDQDVRHGLRLAKSATGVELGDTPSTTADPSSPTSATSPSRQDPDFDPTSTADDSDLEETGDPSAPDPSAPVTKAWTKAPDRRGPPSNTMIGNEGPPCSMSPTLKPEEFDSDDDVNGCLLSETEMRIKERIWVTENADWLRKDNEKRIRKAIREMNTARLGEGGAEVGAGPDGKGGKDGKGKHRKRAGRLGDVRYLDEDDAEGEGDAEGAGGGDGRRRRRERSATEAMEKMLARRAPSRRVNYESLEEIYGSRRGSSASASARSRSRSISVATTVAGDRREGSLSVVSNASAAPDARPTTSPPAESQSAAASTALRPHQTQTQSEASLTHAHPPSVTAASVSASASEQGEGELVGSIDSDDDDEVSSSALSSALSSARFQQQLSRSQSAVDADGEGEEGEDGSGSEGDYVDDEDDEDGEGEGAGEVEVDLDDVFEGRRR